VTEKKNFLDYIYGGCEINLSVAIDFSSSNGYRTDSKSLHSSDDIRNKYLQAIKSAVTIMQYYNSTKKIASYGFGAKVVANHKNSDCFALNGDIFSPEVNGVAGLIETY